METDPSIEFSIHFANYYKFCTGWMDIDYEIVDENWSILYDGPIHILSVNHIKSTEEFKYHLIDLYEMDYKQYLEHLSSKSKQDKIKLLRQLEVEIKDLENSAISFGKYDARNYKYFKRYRLNRKPYNANTPTVMNEEEIIVAVEPFVSAFLEASARFKR